MGKFSENFEKHKIKEWKNSYLNYKSLKEKIKEKINELEETPKESLNLNNTFKQNDEEIDLSGNLSSMYNQEPHGKFLQEFISLLDQDFKKIYFKFVAMEKELYIQLNSHLYLEKNLKTSTIDELKTELDSLCLTIFLARELKRFIDDNITAMKRILTKFDNAFYHYYGFVSYLYFSSKLAYQNSDLDYMIQYKVIDEANALIEDIVDNIRNILKQHQDQQEVVNLRDYVENKIDEIKFYILKIDKDNRYRVKCKEWFYYIRQGSSIIKNNPENFKNDIYNPLTSSSLYNDSLIGKLISENVKKKISQKYNISMSFVNLKNIIICFIHTFLGNYFYMCVIPVMNIICQDSDTNDKKDYKYFLLWILVPLSNFISNFAYDKLKINKIKISLIISTLFLIVGNLFSTIKVNESYFIGMIISRIFIGLGMNPLASKKYITQFVPKNSLPKISILYLLIRKLGFTLGPVIGLLLYLLFKELDDKKIILIIYIGKLSIPGWFGFWISILLLFVIIFLFRIPENVSLAKGNLGTEFLGIGKNPSISIAKEGYAPLISTDEKQLIQDIDTKLSEFNEKNQFSDMNLIPLYLNDLINKQKKCLSYLNKAITIILLLFIFSSLFNEAIMLSLADNISQSDVPPFTIIFFTGLIVESTVSVLTARFVYSYTLSLKSLIICQIATIVFFLVILFAFSFNQKNIGVIMYYFILSSTSLIQIISSNLIANIMPPQWKIFNLSYGILMYYGIIIGQILGCGYGLLFLIFVEFSDKIGFPHTLIVVSVGPIFYLILLLFIRNNYSELRVKAISRILRNKLLSKLN